MIIEYPSDSRITNPDAHNIFTSSNPNDGSNKEKDGSNKSPSFEEGPCATHATRRDRYRTRLATILLTR